MGRLNVPVFNRVRKFRAWDIEKCEMIPWNILVYTHNIRNVFYRTDMCDLILMDSIGTVDINKVEIYEHDTGNYNGVYGFVQLVDGNYMLRTENGALRIDNWSEFKIEGTLYKSVLYQKSLQKMFASIEY